MRLKIVLDKRSILKTCLGYLNIPLLTAEGKKEPQKPKTLIDLKEIIAMVIGGIISATLIINGSVSEGSALATLIVGYGLGKST